MEPEDYPEGGYIFNNAARNGISFKDYGALIRVTGTDNGYANPAITIDPTSGNAGVPLAPESSPVLNGMNTVGQQNPPNGTATMANSPAATPAATNQPTEVANSDVTSATQGLGQSYFLKNPILAILGENNSNGEPHLDKNYPGYNFGISDQRRALEFNKDFDRMLANGTPADVHLPVPAEWTTPATRRQQPISASPAAALPARS